MPEGAIDRGQRRPFGLVLLIWELLGPILILVLVGIAALTIADNVGELRRK